MKRSEADLMLNGVDEKSISEAKEKNTVQRKNRKIKMIGVIGVIVVSLSLISRAVYYFLTHTITRDLVKSIECISYDGINMYYGQEERIGINSFLLKFKKGDKIEEFCNETDTWYKLKNSDNIKTIIRDDGNDVTEWSFENYSFDEGAALNSGWIVENIFSIRSKEDIKNLTVNDKICELNDSQKEMLYLKLLELKWPRTDEEQSWMEDISVKKVENDYAELIKLNINTENETFHFMIDRDSKVFRLDENVYSLFSIMTDDEFNNIVSPQ